MLADCGGAGARRRRLRHRASATGPSARCRRPRRLRAPAASRAPSAPRRARSNIVVEGRRALRVRRALVDSPDAVPRGRGRRRSPTTRRPTSGGAARARRRACGRASTASPRGRAHIADDADAASLAADRPGAPLVRRSRRRSTSTRPTRQRLLASRDAAARLRELDALLARVVDDIEARAEVHRRAPSNGHGRTGARMTTPTSSIATIDDTLAAAARGDRRRAARAPPPQRAARVRVRRAAGLPPASRARRLSRHARRARRRRARCWPTTSRRSSPRGAGTGLSGGVARRWRGAARAQPAQAHPPRRRREPARHRGAGRRERGAHARGRAVRPALRARPVEPDGVHDRRQRRRECGRPALPQVRRHAQPRARVHGRASRRRGRDARRSRRRGRRLRPAGRVHRQRGMLRRRARRDRAPRAQPAGRAHAARRLHERRCRGRAR